MPPKKTSAPPSAKPASKSARPPSSRSQPQAAAPVQPAQEPATDMEMSDSTPETPKVNGTAGGSKTRPSESDEKPAKKGRLGEIKEEVKRGRRRSSLGLVVANTIPQAPEVSNPHNSLFVFGTGDMGQFGLGPDQLDEIARPKLHTWIEEKIKETGELSRDGKVGTGGLETIAAGGMHNLAIDESGKVRSWGINDNAALGRETANNPDPANPGSSLPAEDFETWPLVVQSLADEGFRAVKVAAGDSVSVALSDKGELRAWGSFRSNDGILGFDGVPSHPKFQFTPIPLPGLNKLQIVDVSCGENHVLALTTTGHVYTWGSGEMTQLGRRIIERRRLRGLEPERLALRNIVHVSTGIYHSFAIDSSGTVWAWGLNTYRQTGISSSRGGDQEMILIPTQVDALSPDEHDGSKVVEISGGQHHSLFRFDNGQVWGVGRTDANELGLSEDHPAMDGVRERRAESKQQKEERVVERETALEKAGTKGNEDEIEKVEASLAEARASLRIPIGEYVPEPVRICFPPIPESYEVVPDFPDYKDTKTDDNPIACISAGTRHNLAVSVSGHVYAWGLGNQAQLGLGADEETASVPTLVRSKQLKPYKAISASAGGQHCLLLAHLRENGSKDKMDESR